MPGPRVHAGVYGCVPGCGVGCLTIFAVPAAVTAVLFRRLGRR